MISWIVASHDPRILDTVLLPSLGSVERLRDEVIVVRDAPSITDAYGRGQELATQSVRCYIHHDVQILDLDRLRTVLGLQTGLRSLATGAPVGIVGVVGSRDQRMPWWEGDKLGSVVDARLGLLDFGPGGQAAILDGLLLATRHHIDWDLEAPGWHGYDHDACAQMTARGFQNWCLTGGHELVRHETAGPTDTARLAGWDTAVARFRERWGVPA